MDKLIPTLLVAAIAGAIAALATHRIVGPGAPGAGGDDTVALVDERDDDFGDSCVERPDLCAEEEPPVEEVDVLEPPPFVSDAQDDVYLVREHYVIPRSSDYMKTFIDYVANCEAPDIALAPGWMQEFFRNGLGSPNVNRIEFMTPIAPNAVRYSIFPRKLDRNELVTLGLLCQDTVAWCPCFDEATVAETEEASCVQTPGETAMRPAYESRPEGTFGTAQVVASTDSELTFRDEPRCEGECRLKRKGARFVCRSEAGERAITRRDYLACQQELTRGLGMLPVEVCQPAGAGEVHF